MAQSIDFGGNTFLDSSAVMMRSGSATNRKALDVWASGINNTLSHNLPSSGSVLMRLADNTTGFVFIVSPSANVSGVYGIGCTSSGTAYFQELVAGADIAMTRNSGNIRFTNNNTGNAGTMLVLLVSGSYTYE